MGKRRGPPDICLEYAFDRLFTAKLQRVYEILVPDRARVTGEVATSIGERHEERRDLRQSFLRPTEGREHDREPTAALIAFAQEHDYHVPREWIFEDEGFSGANLQRPGLEQIRDLAAEGQLQAVLVYSPDRLSRKYAYQVLLLEEFVRHGVETIFIKAPQGHSPEDQLLVQFQGMIAEYERAQILERSRRGKRHHA